MWDDERVLSLDMETLIDEELQSDTSDGPMAERISSQRRWTTHLIYKYNSCDNVLTLDNLKAMAKIEKKILQIKEWPILCEATSSADSGCASDAYVSFASQFSSPETTTEAELEAKLSELTTGQTYNSLKYLFDKGFSSSN